MYTGRFFRPTEVSPSYFGGRPTQTSTQIPLSANTTSLTDVGLAIGLPQLVAVVELHPLVPGRRLGGGLRPCDPFSALKAWSHSQSHYTGATPNKVAAKLETLDCKIDLPTPHTEWSLGLWGANCDFQLAK